MDFFLHLVAMIRTLFFVFALAFIAACRRDVPIPDDIPDEDTGVVFNLDQVPYPKLSDYKFFTGALKNLNPNERALPYEPITPLFSDYAHKSRFVWMMKDSSAQYVSDHSLFDFPDGTVFIKNFYYDNVVPSGERKILETRLLYKKEGEWKFADYIWNQDQSEAVYETNGSYVPVQWIDDQGDNQSLTFRIPSEVECFTCHKSNGNKIPIAPKPQNLDKDFSYPDGVKNQLVKWQEVGYLTGNVPGTIARVADWTDDTQPLETRVRSYLDINCGFCHSDGGHCNYRPIRLEFFKTLDPAMLGVCEIPQQFITPQLTHVIARSNIARSVMHFRMSSTDPQYMMPLLGRSVVHQEAVDLLGQYILSLTPICN